MTIVDVKQLTDESGIDDAGVKYRQLYHVYFTGTFSGAALLYNSDSRLPKRLNDHPSDGNAYCQTVLINVINEDSPNPGAGQQSIASYLCSFAQKSPFFAVNPLSRPAEIKWAGSDITETVKIDYNGNPIVNSAGDLYESLPERPIRGAECSITRNEANNPAAIIANYSYSTNDSAVFVVGGVPQVGTGNGLMGKIEAAKANETVLGSVVTYWKVTYPLRFRNDLWTLKLLDNGYRAKNPSTSVIEDMRDTFGQKPSTPLWLDGSGNKLADGGTPVVYPSGGYKIDQPQNWSALSLPNPFA